MLFSKIIEYGIGNTEPTSGMTITISSNTFVNAGVISDIVS